MTSERALIDTNVLVYAMDPQDERHPACEALLERTGDPPLASASPPRVLAEFYRVVTDPRKVPHARTVGEALTC